MSDTGEEENTMDTTFSEEDGASEGDMTTILIGGQDGSVGKKRGSKRKAKVDLLAMIGPLDTSVAEQIKDGSGHRERKGVDLYQDTSRIEKKEFVIIPGTGIELGRIPGIFEQINDSKNKADDFKTLHSILFNRVGKKTEIKKNLKQFSGFYFHPLSDELKNKKKKMLKYTKRDLKFVCNILGIKHDTTPKMVDDILEFCLEPSEEGRKFRHDSPKKSVSTPAKKVASTPAKKAASTPAKKAASTPAKKAASTPATKTALTPTKKTALTPVKKTALTPVKKTALTPVKKTALTQAKKTASTPIKKTASTPIKKTASTVAKKLVSATAKPKTGPSKEKGMKRKTVDILDGDSDNPLPSPSPPKKRSRRSATKPDVKKKPF